MNLIGVIKVLEVSLSDNRHVMNIKSTLYEQESITYSCDDVTVTVNTDEISNVFQICLVLQNDLFYLYLQYHVSDGFERHSKYLIDDITDLVL